MESPARPLSLSVHGPATAYPPKPPTPPHPNHTLTIFPRDEEVLAVQLGGLQDWGLLVGFERAQLQLMALAVHHRRAQPRVATHQRSACSAHACPSWHTTYSPPRNERVSVCPHPPTPTPAPTLTRPRNLDLNPPCAPTHSHTPTAPYPPAGTTPDLLAAWLRRGGRSRAGRAAPG